MRIYVLIYMVFFLLLFRGNFVLYILLCTSLSVFDEHKCNKYDKLKYAKM
jgi:hypothetical protein